MYAPNTLKGILSDSIFSRMIMDGNLKTVTTTCESYVTEHVSQAQPEKQALRFYYYAHLVGVVKSIYSPYEELPPPVAEIVNVYVSILKDQAKRLFYYSLLICTRESRHVLDLPKFHAEWDIHNKLGKARGDLAYRFFSSLKSCGSNTAVTALYNETPNLPLKLYVKLLWDLFDKGSYHGGYGGKAWAEVCLNLVKFVTGEYNAEIFVDTSYTLSHNNGSIFNKGMLYLKYGSKFTQVLDVQRSGQIPQYISCGSLFETGISSHIVQDHNEILKGKVLTTEYVDWYKVEFLGAVDNYSHLQLGQQKLYGESEYQKLITKKKLDEAEAYTIAKELKQKEEAQKALLSLTGGSPLPDSYTSSNKVVNFGIKPDHSYVVLQRKVQP